MRQDSYCRLHEACLAMANQCTDPEVKTRWLAMADAWLQRSMELDQRRVMKTSLGHMQGHRAQVQPIGADRPGCELDAYLMRAPRRPRHRVRAL
jgi:hypothetical protein